MKKLFLSFAAVLLTLLVFVACGDNNENEEKDTPLSNASFAGVTTSTGNDGSDPFVTDKTTYTVTVDNSSSTLSILMEKSQFVGNMPAFDITLPAIPFTLNAAGVAVFRADDIVPTIGGAPFKAFPISALAGTYSEAAGLNFAFTCTPATMHGIVYQVEVNATTRQ